MREGSPQQAILMKNNPILKQQALKRRVNDKKARNAVKIFADLKKFECLIPRNQ